MRKSLWRTIGKLSFWLGWPVLYFYLRGSTRTRVVIFAEGSVLAGKSWLGDGRWELPGGGVRKSEDVIAGALREVKEETGLVLEASQLQPISGFETAIRTMPFKCRPFFVRLSSRPAVTPQKGEISVLEWKTLADLDDSNTEPASWKAISRLTEQGLL